MKTENELKLGVDEALKGAEFRRKSSTWYRDLHETVLVVDVQKSNFGEQYYVNLGVLVKGLPVPDGGKLPPKENQCHIRLRIEALKHDEEDQLKQILNLEDGSIGAADRKQGIARAIVRIALPFLMQCSTRAGIKDADRQGQLDSALVHKSIRDAILSP
jgi:hypothetical protein